MRCAQNLVAVPLLLALVGCGAQQGPAPKDRKDQDEDPPPPAPCVYPEFGTLEGVGSVMPLVKWRGAFWPDGTQVDFSLEDFHCDAAWDSYTSITFVIFAEWCPNCPDYLDFVASLAADLELAGSFLMILDMETRNYQLPSNESAHAYVTRQIGNTWGLRAGEADAEPRGLIFDSPIWSAVPGAWVVRRDTMEVVVNQDDWQTILNFPQIAKNLDADWSDPNNPPFFNMCGEGDEEASEPNDLPNQAAPLAPGVHHGGICADAPDFYQVDIEGAWRIDLTLNPSLGDLDVWVVAPGTAQPLQQNGAYVGSYTDQALESFTHSGPATVMVNGYLRSSAPYTLTLTAL